MGEEATICDGAVPMVQALLMTNITLMTQEDRAAISELSPILPQNFDCRDNS
jgi:hypothetical protein